MLWDQERTEQCVKLWNEGYSASEVASMIGGKVSRNAVIGKLHRLGKKRDAPRRASGGQVQGGRTRSRQIYGAKLWSESDFETLRDLWDQQVSVEQIARRLGRSSGAVADKAKMIGLRPHGVPRSITCDAPLPPEPQRPDTLFKLVDLEDNQCRFFYGDPRRDDGGFCGCPNAPGTSYCEGHLAMCTQAPEPRRRLKNVDVPRTATHQHRIDEALEAVG